MRWIAAMLASGGDRLPVSIALPRRRWRARVFARDRGVCSDCGRDTVALAAQLGELRGAGFWVRRDVRRAAQWEADHVVPLWRGGSDALENLATRCGLCHDAKTADEAAQRARARAPRSWKATHGLCEGSGRRPARRRQAGLDREYQCTGCGRPASGAEAGHRRIRPHRPPAEVAAGA